MVWKHSIVYLATNRLNGKRYVGATSNGLNIRQRQHIRAAERGDCNCRAFGRALTKYGANAFEWSVIFQTSNPEDAFNAEVRLIRELRPEYNLTIGGRGSRGRVVSLEEARASSIRNKGRKHTPEARAKIAAFHTGAKRSPEAREAMSAARRGKPFSESHRRNLSIAISNSEKVKAAQRKASADPEKKKRRMAGLYALWERRRATKAGGEYVG